MSRYYKTIKVVVACDYKYTINVNKEHVYEPPFFITLLQLLNIKLENKTNIIKQMFKLYTTGMN